MYFHPVEIIFPSVRFVYKNQFVTCKNQFMIVTESIFAWSTFVEGSTQRMIFLNRPFQASFSFFSSFQYSWQKQMFYIKICWWLDSNQGSPSSEATTLPTEPQPLPMMVLFGVHTNRENMLGDYRKAYLNANRSQVPMNSTYDQA